MKKAKVITMINQKGGTGKTTITLALAYGLAARGYKVLAVDTDEQASLTLSLTRGRYDQSKTILEVFRQSLPAKDTAQTISKHISLIPAPDKSRFAGIGVELARTGNYYADILKKALAPLLSNYDYILIDTPPEKSIVTTNTLTAANWLIIPVKTDFYSLQGLTNLAETINEDKENINPKLKVAGILINDYRGQTVYAQKVAAMLNKSAKKLDTIVFKNKIREAITVSEAQHLGKPIFKHDPRGKVTKDLNGFIDELVEVTNK